VEWAHWERCQGCCWSVALDAVAPTALLAKLVHMSVAFSVVAGKGDKGPEGIAHSNGCWLACAQILLFSHHDLHVAATNGCHP